MPADRLLGRRHLFRNGPLRRNGLFVRRGQLVYWGIRWWHVRNRIRREEYSSRGKWPPSRSRRSIHGNRQYPSQPDKHQLSKASSNV